MKLDKTIPFFQQLEGIKKTGVEIIADLTGERMGDKAAFVSVAAWIAEKADCRITLVEDSGDMLTAFKLLPYADQLSQYGLNVSQVEYGENLGDKFDIHTLGLGWKYESLWTLNAYLYSIGKKVSLQYPDVIGNAVRSNIFCYLKDVQYNERRNMSVYSTLQTLQALKNSGYDTTLLLSGPVPELEGGKLLPFDQALHSVLSADTVIAGDTGFSHVAALFDIPLIALYPDWMHEGGYCKLTRAITISEWFEIPAQQCAPMFMPNAKRELLHLIEIGTDHRWSIEEVRRGMVLLQSNKVTNPITV